MMEIRDKAISFVKNTSYERKAFALFWLAVAIKNFYITRRRLLHFALVTGALGGSVWMVVEAIRQAFSDDDDAGEAISTKLAKGLQKRDVATLNLLLARAELIAGKCALFDENALSEKDLNFLHKQLSILDNRLAQMRVSTSYRSETLFSLSKGKDLKVIFLNVPKASYSWHWDGKTFTRDQYAHLCYGYCQIRDDLFTAVHLTSTESGYGEREETCKIYSSDSKDSPPEERSTITYPLPREREQTKADLHVLNQYLEAGGGVQLEAFPENTEGDVVELFEAINQIQEFLESSFRSFHIAKKEIKISSKTWVSFSADVELNLLGKVGVNFPELPEDFFLSKEQLKALFLGQIALHPNILGVQPNEDESYLLWKKEELIEASSRGQLGKLAELKQDWELLIEAIKTGKTTNDPSHMLIEVEDEGKGDVLVTFQPTEIGGKKYLVVGTQRLCFSPENAHALLVGCRLSGDFPGIVEIKEEEPGIKYRLKKQQI